MSTRDGTIATLVRILRAHDAGQVGYRVGDWPLMRDLLAALGWQGGTIHEALREARRRVDTARRNACRAQREDAALSLYVEATGHLPPFFVDPNDVPEEDYRSVLDRWRR